MALDEDAALRLLGGEHERSGTIVAGENVKISTVAVTHGNLAGELVAAAQVGQVAGSQDRDPGADRHGQ